METTETIETRKLICHFTDAPGCNELFVPTEMAFNVDDLLNTKSTPSQEQRNNLQNVILQLDEDISGIDDQILVLQAKILVLQTSRTGLVQ